MDYVSLLLVHLTGPSTFKSFVRPALRFVYSGSIPHFIALRGDFGNSFSNRIPDSEIRSFNKIKKDALFKKPLTQLQINRLT